MNQKYFITTAIDYANDVIHIGHAYEKILADVLARHYRGVVGKGNVFFLTGTDEHGQKVQQAAEKAGAGPKEFTDDISGKDKAEIESLGVSFDRFIRTTDEDHVTFVEQFWQKVDKAGFISLGEYTGLYCEGDEAFITESDLVNGKCPNHPNTELKTITEKNYFFDWPKFQAFLEELIKNPSFIPSDVRRHEMLGFLKKGLEKLTISRRKEAVSWGIPVPGDTDQVIYVWFDALINYLTVGSKENYWDDKTTIIHFVGKDILRWHTLLWPAMLKAADYALPSRVFAHGFLSLNGQKISKSIGNVIRPSELIEKYGVDTVRYYLTRYTRIDDDADLDLTHLETVYNADLANGLGNLVSRVAKLAETSGYENSHTPKTYHALIEERTQVKEVIEAVNYPEALQAVWQEITDLDVDINENQPWTLIKSNEVAQAQEVLDRYVGRILDLGILLTPFMPTTAEKIVKQYSQKQIRAEAPLFPRFG